MHYCRNNRNFHRRTILDKHQKKKSSSSVSYRLFGSAQVMNKLVGILTQIITTIETFTALSNDTSLLTVTLKAPVPARLTKKH